MDKTKVMREKASKTIPISIRIPMSAYKFIKKNNYSPTKIFMVSLNKLGWRKEIRK